MLKKNIIVLFLVFVFSYPQINYLRAEELNISSESDKKYNFSICAIFKNEARNLKDWIEYHIHLGVDHFYLYNIGSQDSFMSILLPYITDGMVTLINWPEVRQDDKDGYTCALSTQFPAYENAVNFVAREETKWIVLIDIDEYLVCPKGNMTDLLADYDVFPSISLTANDCDNTNDFNNTSKNPISLQPHSSLMHSDQDAKIMDKSKLVAKMIFKPDLCAGFTSPPYQCYFNTYQPGIEADPQELRIKHRPNKSKKVASSKSKILKQDGSFFVEFIDREQVYDYRYIPMYLFMPDFLKKLKSKQHEDVPFFKPVLAP